MTLYNNQNNGKTIHTKIKLYESLIVVYQNLTLFLLEHFLKTVKNKPNNFFVFWSCNNTDMKFNYVIKSSSIVKKI